MKFSEIVFLWIFNVHASRDLETKHEGDIVDHHDTAGVQTWRAHRFMIIFMQQANRVDCQCQDLYMH